MYNKQLITPTIAKQYLEANIKNRRVKDPVVLRYANDMKSGRWKYPTAEVLKISKTGLILDGQHRLHAVIKSGVPVYFDVATGLEDDVFDVLDTGSTRNSSDVFKISGIKHETIIPSIVQLYFILKSGSSATKDVQKNHRLTNAQLLTAYHNNEDYWQTTAKRVMAWYVQFAKILPPSVLGAMYALFNDINEQQAMSFMNQLAGNEATTSNVINLLRQKLMQDKMSIKKMPSGVKHGLIIKAWNAYRTKQALKLLRFDPEKEGFPRAA